ncbi:MAG: M55 family metallopeptidase [Phycisphaerae bacterium]
MKVFIAADMEGVAGLAQWDDSEIELQKRLMTEEINAAARGAFAGGATQIVAGQSHSSMRYLLPELLDARVSMVAGQPKKSNHMGGVDSSFGLAIFVGYHARAGTLRGVMSHTFSGVVFSLSFNGVEMGEVGVDAALCGEHGVAVGMVAGDKAACDEAVALLGPPLRTVAVKEGLSRHCAVCKPLAVARREIEETAADAVRRAKDFRPFIVQGPVTAEVVFTDPSFADAAELLPDIERLDGRTIRYRAPTFSEAFQIHDVTRPLGSVYR